MPRTIAVVSAFLFFAAFIALLTGTSLLLPGTFLDRLWELNKPAYAAFAARGWTTILGVFRVLLGPACGATAIGLRRGKRWAWWFSVALFSINGVGDAVSLFVGTEIWKPLAGIAVAAAFSIF